GPRTAVEERAARQMRGSIRVARSEVFRTAWLFVTPSPPFDDGTSSFFSPFAPFADGGGCNAGTPFDDGASSFVSPLEPFADGDGCNAGTALAPDQPAPGSVRYR